MKWDRARSRRSLRQDHHAVRQAPGGRSGRPEVGTVDFARRQLPVDRVLLLLHEVPRGQEYRVRGQHPNQFARDPLGGHAAHQEVGNLGRHVGRGTDIQRLIVREDCDFFRHEGSGVLRTARKAAREELGGGFRTKYQERQGRGASYQRDSRASRMFVARWCKLWAIWLKRSAFRWFLWRWRVWQFI
jgi:hypothetical protein